MKRHEILDLLHENYEKYLGTNEAEINFCTEIEIEFDKKQKDIDGLVEFIKEVHTRLGVIQQIKSHKLIQKHIKK
jgi:dihydroxyacetone kinase-like predicted kinase